MAQQEQNKNLENTYLLRVIAALLSFGGLVCSLFFNAMLKKMDDISQMKLDFNSYRSNNDEWRKYAGSELDNLRTKVDKIYALKPEDIKVKKESY